MSAREPAESAPSLRITQLRGLIGQGQRQRRTVRALGLRRVRHTVTQPDRPEIRGMLSTVAHLVEVRYVGEDDAVELAPGQEPKGAGNPAAGASVADEQVADLRAAEEEAVEGGDDPDEPGPQAPDA